MRPQLRDAAPANGSPREALLVAIATIAGAVLRLYGLPRLGLVHFDEGIYALAGLWPFRPGGLAAIDPSVIPYAPAGFPFLVGLSNLALGPSDVSAILVSVAAGTLTIPAAAWLARRTFGPGAGAAASALIALSCYHVSFSRMALTDAGFLLAWVLGLVLAGRFLDRPGLLNALGMGAGVGVAQLIKYNGWLVGVAVIAVSIGELVDRETRADRGRLRAVWGYGALAAVVAALVYRPWFRFVEAHGGYAGLMAHHRSYMGGIGTWSDYFGLQFEQADALSGGWAWRLAGCSTAVLAACVVSPARSPQGWVARARIGLGILPAVLLSRFFWVASAASLPAPRRSSASARLLAAAWLLMAVLTPFYHPYARLWMPLLLLCWVLVAGLAARLVGAADGAAADRPQELLAETLRRSSTAGRLGLALLLLPVALVLAPDLMPRPMPAGPPSGLGPWTPTDSLKTAVLDALEEVPPSVPGLRVLARPAVVFYVGGRRSVQSEPGLARLLEPGPVGSWALIDAALLDQEGDRAAGLTAILKRWEVVREFPGRLSLPALLDRDPSAARRSSLESAASVPLWLLRPRTPGAS